MNADEYGCNKQLQMQIISVLQSKDRKVKMDMYTCIHEGENFKDMNLLDECGWICGAKKHLVTRTTIAVFFILFVCISSEKYCQKLWRNPVDHLWEIRRLVVGLDECGWIWEQQALSDADLCISFFCLFLFEYFCIHEDMNLLDE